jgi:two-component system response regulator HupR/HoxA
MTDSIERSQRARIELSDGSRLELTFTPAPQRQAVDLARLTTLLKLDLEKKSSHELVTDHRGLVGQSSVMQAMFRMVVKVAPTNATVLITGENGTGKELVAKAIHDGSPRASKPFVAANCSAFNDNLLESELFGHRRGAFTGAVADKRGLFEEADTGTFLLDEVGDMSPALQVKLLRVLQEGTFMPVGGTQTKKVDVRIIAATNKDLGALVRKGAFREDLYYRLHVVALRTPPLRERGEDIDRLIGHFLRRLCERHGGRQKILHPETAERLRGHRWPGNVRELQNEIERIWVLSGEDPVIGPEHLSKTILAAPPLLEATSGSVSQETAVEGAESAEELPSEPLNVSLERVERQLIERALRKVQGNRTRAAQVLGVSRRNLIRKLQQFGLAGTDEADASD